MSDIDKGVVGSKRRLLSSDFNNSERLRDRALIESLSALQLGDDYKQLANGLGGVISGLIVRAVVGTNEIEVQPGIALMSEIPADATFDPPVNWIEVSSPTRLDLNALVDPALPRLVTIEIAPNLVTIIDGPVDVFDGATGGFTVQVQDIVTGSDPIISARAGTPSATPVVAAGPGANGQLPLAVIKLATAQASFTDQFVAVLSCRPILLAVGGLLVPPDAIEGGGFSVGEVSGGLIVNTSVAELHDTRLELNGFIARGRGPAEFQGTNIRTESGKTVAGLFGTVQPLYAYAVEPPWLADYGQIAPRECLASNPNDVNRFTTAESVVLGDGGTFASLAYANITRQYALENMILMFDSVAPAGISNGTAGPGAGAPRIDNARGPHPTTDGGGAITLDATQDPSWGSPQVVAKSAYLGCASSLGTGTRLMGQSYRGRGQIRAIDEVDLGGTSFRPVLNTAVSSGALDPLYPGRYPGMLLADDEIIPTFTTRVDIAGQISNNGGAGTVSLDLKSSYGFGAAQPNPGGLVGVFTIGYEGADLPGTSVFTHEFVGLDRDNTGQVFHTIGVGAAGTGTLVLSAYDDPFLAAR